MNNDKTGIIYEILPRKNYLARKAIKTRGASYRGERLEQVIAANIDNVFIVISITEPDFNNKTLDRFLVACESSHLNITIILNKIDLVEKSVVYPWLNLYKKIGYSILPTTIKDDSSILNLSELLTGKRNLFWGQSGVGKSSILNKLYPDLKLKVGDISKFNLKGTHTTVTSSMICVDDSTFIIDTPGVREIDPYGIKKEDLGHYFTEFSMFLPNCKFNTCTHHHEPGCAVISAVENNKISEVRYDSYLRILETIEKDINF